MKFSPKPDSASLIVGHDSTKNSDSSGLQLDHADEIWVRNICGEIHCYFCDENPSIKAEVYMFNPN